jgi:hypothetical protein
VTTLVVQTVVRAPINGHQRLLLERVVSTVDYQGQSPDHNDLELKIPFVNYIKYVSSFYSLGDKIKTLTFTQ